MYPFSLAPGSVLTSSAAGIEAKKLFDFLLVGPYGLR